MQAILNDLSNASSVKAALKANWLSYHYHLWQAENVEMAVGPYLTWLVTEIPDHFMNVVVCSQLPEDDIEDIFEEAMAHFRELNVSRLSWLIEENARAEVVKSHLLAHGLTLRDSFAIEMAADLGALPDDIRLPDGLSIFPVENRETLQQWIRVASSGFGVAEKYENAWCDIFDNVVFAPPFHTYLAFLNGRPVATAQLFAYSGVAGIYNITCLPEARGRGIGTALTVTPLLDARKLGYRVGILQASELGLNVYRKLGFQEYGKLSVLAWQRE